jgi:excisionase family DNA binding protein
MLERLDEIKELIQSNEKPLTLKEAAEYLDLSEAHVYYLVHTNKMTYYKPGGKRIYFRKSDLNVYIYRIARQSDREIEQMAIDHNFKQGK